MPSGMDATVEQGPHGCALCSTKVFVTFDPSKVKHSQYRA
ncbi:hypothetical protein J576_0388 [Acinetobacter sp. 766875]|nr:hypothetical protein J576_0388 [Acinetobacter sp. 766875]